MIGNSFRAARRSGLKHKGYSLINIFGLSLGIAACFLIVLWVRDELSYDRFQVQGDRICRALWEARFGDNEWKIPLVDVPLAETLRREFPEVEQTVRFCRGGLTLRLADADIREDRGIFADDSFFRVFTVPVIAGDPRAALRDPEAVVLTEGTARRYFRDENPIGRTLQTGDGRLLRVTAVVKEFPPASHFHFDFLAPLQSLSFVKERESRWGFATVYTYLLLRPGVRPEDLRARLQAYVDKNILPREYLQTGGYWRYALQPLRTIHLRSHLQYELEPNGSLEYVYLFSIVALFILLLACINYINLATARSLTRAREVGIRKVLGSDRRQLIRQFLAESFYYVLLAVVLAAVLARLALPAFNRLSGKSIPAGILQAPFIVATLAVLTLLVTLVAGAYPAFVLASFPPARVLKSRAGVHSGRERLRQMLVVAQFSVSVGLIAGTLVVRGQLGFIQSRKLGFDKEHVLVVHRAGALGDHYAAFRDRLRSQPRVVDASAAQNLPGQEFDSTVFEPEQPANYRQTSLTYTNVDEHYVDVLKLKIISGRNFSPGLATDSASFLLNRSAVRALGWADPLGKRIGMGQDTRGSVIGVVEDFHIESLRHEVKPMVLMLNRWRPSYVAVRLRPGDVGEGIAAVRAAWREIAPHQPFEFSFLDEDYQKLYTGEQKVGGLFVAFSALALVIACLGLFGLASFVAAQRTREIGLRKVLGASASGLVGMLSKDFLKLVLLADVIAGPISYMAMNRWLGSFAYHTPIAWWMFAIPGGLSLGIALLTVSGQAVKAALLNPVDALRYE